MTLTREARCAKANAAIIHLKSRPSFFIREKSLWISWCGYSMKTGEPIAQESRVRIVGQHFDNHDRQPWGGNQGRALVYLAQWVRTGKMPLTVKDWERWCGSPVSLGNAKFLAAIKQHVYGITPDGGRCE